MKLHTTIRSLGFGCFGEQLHLQLTTRWFRIKKEMPRRLKLLTPPLPNPPKSCRKQKLCDKIKSILQEHHEYSV